MTLIKKRDVERHFAERRARALPLADSAGKPAADPDGTSATTQPKRVIPIDTFGAKRGSPLPASAPAPAEPGTSGSAPS